MTPRPQSATSSAPVQVDDESKRVVEAAREVGDPLCLPARAEPDPHHPPAMTVAQVLAPERYEKVAGARTRCRPPTSGARGRRPAGSRRGNGPRASAGDSSASSGATRRRRPGARRRRLRRLGASLGADLVALVDRRVEPAGSGLEREAVRVPQAAARRRAGRSRPAAARARWRSGDPSRGRRRRSSRSRDRAACRGRRRRCPAGAARTGRPRTTIRRPTSEEPCERVPREPSLLGDVERRPSSQASPSGVREPTRDDERLPRSAPRDDDVCPCPGSRRAGHPAPRPSPSDARGRTRRSSPGNRRARRRSPSAPRRQVRARAR